MWSRDREQTRSIQTNKPNLGPAPIKHQGETTMKKLLISAVAVAVLGLTTFQASAYQRWFDLVNDTGSTIVSVRATNIDDPSFHGRDLLGDYVFRLAQHMGTHTGHPQGLR